MSPDLERIKARIRHLLAVAENHASTAGEIDNAMRFAAQLMAAHQVTREDLADLDPESRAGRIEFGRHARYSFGARLAFWENSLANFCGEFLGTVRWYLERGVVRRRGGVAITDGRGQVLTAGRLSFYGPDEDAQFAAELFEEISVATATLARLRWGGFARGAGADYCLGFVGGLREAYVRETAALTNSADPPTRALVLRSQQTALAIRESAGDWMAQTHGARPRTKTVWRRNQDWHEEAYDEGKADGRQYQLGAKPDPTPQLEGPRS